MDRNQRRRRKAKRNKFLLKLALLAMEILILYFVLRRSTLFKVKFIDIMGNERINREKIIELSGVKYEENLLRLSKGKIEERIKKEPYIDTVRVKKKLLHRLLIEISEKKPVAYFTFENSKILVDEKLNFLEVAETADDIPNGIECRGFLKTLPMDDETLKKELAIYIENDFFNSFFNSILFSKADWLEVFDQSVQIYCKDSTEILFGTPFDAGYKINLLSEVFRDLEATKTRAKRIDMTQRFTIVTKVEGEEDESE